MTTEGARPAPTMAGGAAPSPGPGPTDEAGAGGRTDPRGLLAASTAVTLMGIGSVVAKASDIAGPVLALHRAWVAAVLYVGLLLAMGNRITRASLRAAAPGGLFFGVQLAFFFSSIQLTTVANATVR